MNNVIDIHEHMTKPLPVRRMKAEHIAGMVIGIPTMFALWWFYGWGLMALIYLMLYANNLSQVDR